MPITGFGLPKCAPRWEQQNTLNILDSALALAMRRAASPQSGGESPAPHCSSEQQREEKYHFKIAIAILAITSADFPEVIWHPHWQLSPCHVALWSSAGKENPMEKLSLWGRNRIHIRFTISITYVFNTPLLVTKSSKGNARFNSFTVIHTLKWHRHYHNLKQVECVSGQTSQVGSLTSKLFPKKAPC